jgi:predicted small metal-binding protein
MANISGNNPREQKTFRCSDLGHKDCKWEVSGQSEEELMPQIEQHGRQAHNIQNLDNEARNRVRGAIRDRAA